LLAWLSHEFVDLFFDDFKASHPKRGEVRGF
jgi:hypothetical protein